MIDLGNGRRLLAGFVGDPAWIDFGHRTVAEIDAARGHPLDAVPEQRPRQPHVRLVRAGV